MEGTMSHNHHTVEWIQSDPTSAARLSQRALKAGRDVDGSQLWIMRSHYGGDLLPGKLAIEHHRAYVTFTGKEISVDNIEVLCARPEHVRWVSARNGSVPHNAVAGGRTAAGETLYVGRAHFNNSLTPGKVQPSHSCLYIPFGGGEHKIQTYEVLCTV